MVTYIIFQHLLASGHMSDEICEQFVALPGYRIDVSHEHDRLAPDLLLVT